MVRTFKQLLWMVVLALGVVDAGAFALLGPFANWQQQVIFYQLPGDNGGPVNLGEEFRRNTPVMYYTFDANYLDYFGSNGVAAAEEAFQTMNGLTNVSSYSADLSEFPLEAQRYNYQAQALSLTDVKSVTLGLLVEELGLAEPERYTWCLHDREVGTLPCPQSVGYTVIKRNFDPAVSALNQYQPSSYVNGNLYSYTILEFCQNTPWLADAAEFPVDPLSPSFTAIASFNTPPGAFYTGLTRDDVGGLRYLMQTNNYNFESAGSNTVTYVTDKSQLQLLVTGDLTTFTQDALVNGPAALTALYPNLQIVSSTPIFTNLVTTNLIFYFTNSPFEPAGYPPSLVTATLVTTNINIFFNHTFANVYITPDVQLISNLQVPLVPGTRLPMESSPPSPRILQQCLWWLCVTGTVCTNISVAQTLTAGIFSGFTFCPPTCVRFRLLQPN